jgi:hypothetical protein
MRSRGEERRFQWLYPNVPQDRLFRETIQWMYGKVLRDHEWPGAP